MDMVEIPTEERNDGVEITDLLDRIRCLDGDLRKNRETISDFKITFQIGKRTINIKEFLLSTRLDLLQKKEQIQEEKSQKREQEKSKFVEMSKALPKYELPLFRSMKEFIPWVLPLKFH